MVAKLVSVKEVIAKVVRDLGLESQIPYEDFIEWIGEALQFIGGYCQYRVKRTCVHVHDHSAELPCDFYKPTYSIDHRHQENQENFFGRYHYKDFQYRIENGHIFTEFREGPLEIEYLAIPTDEEGFPMCPDDVSYFEACKWFIAKNLSLRGEFPAATQLGDKKTSSYEYCRLQWNKYCTQARAAGYMPTIDGMQRMANQYYKLIPDMHEYYNNFRHLGKRQILNRDRR